MIKIMKYGEVANSDIFARAVPTVNVEDVVADIIKNVRERGDAALYEYCEKFDHAKLNALAVTEAELDEAMAAVEPKFIDILKKRLPISASSTKSRCVTALLSMMKTESSSVRRSFPWIVRVCTCPAVRRRTPPRC